jgi:hypothetical protein
MVVADTSVRVDAILEVGGHPLNGVAFCHMSTSSKNFLRNHYQNLEIQKVAEN